MVERVARGKIMVPAAAALTVMAAGAIESGPACAAGREATLQIRVQVVEPCRIRIAPSGALEQSCDGSTAISAPGTIELGNLIGRPTLRLPERPASSLPPNPFAGRQPGTAPPGFTRPTVTWPTTPGPTVTWPTTTGPTTTGPTTTGPTTTRPTATLPSRVAPGSAGARFAAANQRARQIAERISQRVRFITVAY